MNGLFVKNAAVYREGGFAPANLLIENGKFIEIGEACENKPRFPELDAKGLLALPGFLDIHTHGAMGVDVNAADREGLERISAFFASQGTTRWLASVLTDTEAQTLRCIDTIKNGAALGGAQLLGIHLEGPFLAPQYKGAMPEQLLQKGNRGLLERYLAAAQGQLRYITLSPEVEGVAELVPFLKAQGVAVAIGHSGASYAQAMQCIAAGATSTTHTFNGMKLFHQHEPGIMGAALESDIYCEAICDGLHLHPASVRLLLKVKGYSRVIAITDSIMAAGLPDGAYKLGVNDVVVTNGDAQLADGSSRAGSTLTTLGALRNLIKFTGGSLAQVVPLLTENPARMLGLWQDYGSIEVGKAADVVLLDSHLQLHHTLVGGHAITKPNFK